MEGWKLTAISPFDGGVANVSLLIAPEHREKVKGMVNAYNVQAAANGYGVLNLDDKNMVVEGAFSLNQRKEVSLRNAGLKSRMNIIQINNNL